MLGSRPVRPLYKRPCRSSADLCLSNKHAPTRSYVSTVGTFARQDDKEGSQIAGCLHNAQSSMHICQQLLLLLLLLHTSSYALCRSEHERVEP